MFGNGMRFLVTVLTTTAPSHAATHTGVLEAAKAEVEQAQTLLAARSRERELQRMMDAFEHRKVAAQEVQHRANTRLTVYGDQAAPHQRDAAAHARALIKLRKASISELVVQPQRFRQQLQRKRLLRRVVVAHLRELQTFRRVQLQAGAAEQGAGLAASRARIEQVLTAIELAAVRQKIAEVGAAWMHLKATRAVAMRTLEEPSPVLRATVRKARSLGATLEATNHAWGHVMHPPVEGQLLASFGTRKIGGVAVPYDGVELAAKAYEDVHAPWDGVVAQVESIIGFGAVIVIVHDEGRETLLGQLTDVRKQPGDKVTQGEVLARARPRFDVPTGVYLEVHHGDTPVDPMPYLPSSSRKMVPASAESMR